MPKEIHGNLKKVYGDETIDISNVRRLVRSAKVAERGKLFEQEPSSCTPMTNGFRV